MHQFTAAAALAAIAAPALAQLAPVPNRATFDSNFPNAALEDFEEAAVPDGSFANLDATSLDAATLGTDVSFNNFGTVFVPGDIVAGLRVGVAGGSGNMFVSSPGFANYTSHAISYESSATAQPEITVDFLAPSNLAFALDVTGNPAGTLVDVEVFDANGSLGVFQVSGTGAGTFIGFSSTTAVTRVTLTGVASNDFFGVDNIAFIPAPGAAGLLAAAGLAATRRRR